MAIEFLLAAKRMSTAARRRRIRPIGEHVAANEELTMATGRRTSAAAKSAKRAAARKAPTKKAPAKKSIDTSSLFSGRGHRPAQPGKTVKKKK